MAYSACHIFHLGKMCFISLTLIATYAYIWFVFDIDNTLTAPRFPSRTLITGAHRRQFPLAPNLSSGGVARSRARTRRGAGGRAAAGERVGRPLRLSAHGSRLHW